MAIDLSDQIIKAYELNKINDKLEDPNVTRVLLYVSKIMSKPNIPTNAAVEMIAELQTLAFEFHLKYKYYMLLGKGEDDAALKKNLYASLKEATTDLVSALKYTSKA
jgi:hypothetical protein